MEVQKVAAFKLRKGEITGVSQDAIWLSYN
jgi:hypothetical protein